MHTHTDGDSSQSAVQLSLLHDQNMQLENDFLIAIQTASSEIKDQVNSLSKQLKMSSDQNYVEILNHWKAKNENEISYLSAVLSSRAQIEVDRSTQIKILDSLYFTRIDDRYQSIKEAHEKTFKWIFDGRLRSLPW